jgi:geranylgeranyl transferase type-2 subunit beta
MTSEPYLIRLGSRLAQGVARLPAERRDSHRAFIIARQNSDGGFSGREGGSDLYYTGFAVRALAMLGMLDEPTCGKIALFLKSGSRAAVSVIDLTSWLYCALVVQAASGIDLLSGFDAHWPEKLAGEFESFRTADGGYAKTHEGSAGSMYHSFLVALCYELIGQGLPHSEKLVEFVFARQRDDGGFVEIAPMKRGGTNPTAAAVAILKMFDALDDTARCDVAGFLADVAGSEGGFQANTRIPFADGLSTFTGVLTAQDLGRDDLLAPEKAQRFLNSLEQPGGGFTGAAWDTLPDVEYTFYALGGLALLAGRN